MANYAVHYYEVFAEASVLNQIEKEVRSWEGDITIERTEINGPLYFRYPMKYFHDYKSFKELSTKYPNAEFHINVRMEEGPEAYYVALRGTFAIIDIDTRIKEGIHALLSEMYHKDLFDRDVFESIILAFENNDIPWWDAAFRLILGFEKIKPNLNDERVCPHCIKKFHKVNIEKDYLSNEEDTKLIEGELRNELPF
jgi:hypothetical protein